MLDETKQLVSKSMTYSFGNILVKFISFLLIPLYTRKLLPSEYGVVAILEIMEILGKTLFTYGFAQAILRFFIHYKRQGQEHELVFSTFFSVFSINLIILGLLFRFPQTLVNILLFDTAENILYFRYVLVIIFVGAFQVLFILILQAEEKAVQFICFTLFTFLSTVGLNIYKVGFNNEGILGIVQSKFYIAVFNFIIINIYLLTRFRIKFSWQIIKEGLKYGVPLVIVAISINLLAVIDRYLLKVFRDFSEVAIYTISYKFGMIINMALITPFRQAFYPLMFRLSNQNDLSKLYRNFLTYFLFVGFLFFLAISLFAKEVLILATSPKYLEGYIIIPLITLSYLLFGVRNVFANAIAAKKKTNVIAGSTIVATILHICFNMLLIPYIGIKGAALASILSYSFIAGLTYYFQNKLYHINWDWKRASKILINAAVIFLLSLILNISNVYLSVIFKLFLFFSFPIVLYLQDFFYETEINNFKLGLKKILAFLKKLYRKD